MLSLCLPATSSRFLTSSRLQSLSDCYTRCTASTICCSLCVQDITNMQTEPPVAIVDIRYQPAFQTRLQNIGLGRATPLPFSRAPGSLEWAGTPRSRTGSAKKCARRSAVRFWQTTNSLKTHNEHAAFNLRNMVVKGLLKRSNGTCSGNWWYPQQHLVPVQESRSWVMLIAIPNIQPCSQQGLLQQQL